MENYLWPLFRGLHASVLAATGTGQPTVMVAKDKVDFASEQLDVLKAAATPKASKRQSNLAYDVYYRWVIQENDKVVKHLTGKPRRSWLDFERRLERGVVEGVMDIERVNSVLARAIVGLQESEIEGLLAWQEMDEATAMGRTSYDVSAPGGMSKVMVSGDYPKGTVFVADGFPNMVVVRRSKMPVHRSRPQNSAYVVRRPKGSKEFTIFITGIGKAYVIGPVSSGAKLRHLRNVHVFEESLGEATAAGRTSYQVPAPGQVYKPPSPAAMGLQKAEPLTQKNVRRGMSLGSFWVVTKVSPKAVSIAVQSNPKKSFVYRWDGIGYGKQGSYLHTDGERRPLGDVGPVEEKILYPQGTLFFAKGYRFSFVVTGKPVKQSYGGVFYPGRKPKGSKVYNLWVHDGQVRAMSLKGKDDETLYNAMARIPA